MSSSYHLPFFCPKNIDNATFYGVSNGKSIYKCKSCKRAFTDSSTVSTLPKDTEDNEMEEYAYAAPNLTSTTSTSSLIVSNTAKSRKPKTKVQQKFYSAAVKLEKSQSLSGLKKIDRYGGGLDSPQFRPKSVMGGIISVLFIGTMLAVIVTRILITSLFINH